MSFMRKFSFLVFLSSVLTTLLYNQFAPHKVLMRTAPKEKHPQHIFTKVFSNKEFENLVALTRNTTFKMNLRADAQQEFDFASTPIQTNGKCPHPLLHSNEAGDKCIVPARIDVGKHLLLTGGWGAKKEKYEKMVSRAKFFQHFWADFNPENPQIMPEVLRLFERPEYIKEARKVCQNQQYLDPMQASILVALPGQEIGIHYDTPWFYGADRKVFPLWLLVAMRLSGLFDDIAINQVQGVAYLHKWTDAQKMGGGFYYYAEGPSGPMTLVEAIPNRGLIVDGCVMSHGTQTFIPGSKPVDIDKDVDYQIKYNKDTNKWDVSELDSGKFFRSYDENELRITLVWRQRCFEDEAAFQNFQERNKVSKQLKVLEVMDKLLDNLITKGQIKKKPTKDIEIVETIIQNYIKYPYPESKFPYNYCMIPKFFPFTSAFFDYIC